MVSVASGMKDLFRNGHLSSRIVLRTMKSHNDSEFHCITCIKNKTEMFLVCLNSLDIVFVYFLTLFDP